MPTFPSSGLASAPGLTITLADIERATAPRLGPYSLRTQSATKAATITLAYIDDLRSSITLGGVENLWVLRRGKKADGSAVAGFNALDRQRLIAVFDPAADPAAASIQPDRPWVVAPVANEVLELHHLDPANELRPSVQAGLRRCFFEDRATVTLSSAASERDLTSSLSWLSRKAQILRIQHQAAGSTVIPVDVGWAGSFEKSGHVWLADSPDPFPDTLLVTALRAHFTWVNGADSATGPTADDDLLQLDINYAAAAAHIEAWRLFRARLQAAAEGGQQVSQKEAADEFTRQAAVHVGRRHREIALSAPFTLSSLSVATR